MGYARADELEVSALLTETLASDSKIGSIEAARNYLEDFCGRARVVAAACRRAAGSLQSNKGKSGRSRYQWHDEFTAVLVDLCKRNKIEPNVAIDRESGEPTGGLFEVASRFEQLFPAAIRSPTPAALVKRLQRSLKR